MWVGVAQVVYRGHRTVICGIYFMVLCIEGFEVMGREHSIQRLRFCLIVTQSDVDIGDTLGATVGVCLYRREA